MFRSRRRRVVTQLWKCRVVRPPAAGSPAVSPAADDEEQDRCCWSRRRRRDHGDERRGPGHDPSPSADAEVPKCDAMATLERLGLPELELLLEVVRGAGLQVSGCIPAPVDAAPPSGWRPRPPHFVCWLLYRCAEGPRDDMDLADLRKMPGCAGETESSVCCNPYHWSRIAVTSAETSASTSFAIYHVLYRLRYLLLGLSISTNDRFRVSSGFRVRIRLSVGVGYTVTQTCQKLIPTGACALTVE